MAKNLYTVPDREPLRTLPNGMVITRAMKHEPVALDGLKQEQVVWRTGDRLGAKFLTSWPLPRVTDWVEQEVWRRGWQFPPGFHDRVTTRLDEPVGIVCGRVVHTIAVTVADRYVHAYPWEDR